MPPPVNRSSRCRSGNRRASAFTRRAAPHHGWQHGRHLPDAGARRTIEVPGLIAPDQTARGATPLSAPLPGARLQIDRAWTYSFQSDRADPQTQGFHDVAGSLLHGQRVGQATDRFNIRWAALSTELADVLRDRSAGAAVSDTEPALRVARDDARNYVVLCDPAARLRVRETMG
ncbi:hypothetical protein AWV79_34925 [Cupriavidus sp. UYMMa02A]|nr:hypothetical protein AWV79_34925 [Cupriavidus sp. UYMMa02A]